MTSKMQGHLEQSPEWRAHRRSRELLPIVNCVSEIVFCKMSADYNKHTQF